MDIKPTKASSAVVDPPHQCKVKGPNKKTPCPCFTMKQEVSILSDKDLLLQVLLDLPPVELKKFHWYLTQKLRQNFPPIPTHWLSSADVWSTAETMVRCYQEEGAVRLTAEILGLMGWSDQAGELCNRCCRAAVPPTPWPDSKPRPNCMETLRRELIDRMEHSGDVLSALQTHGLLDEAEAEAVSIYATRRDKNRALVDMVLKKGAKAQEMFYLALSQSEPFLLAELDSISKQSVAAVHIGHLELDLVSDEERLFHWLVSQQAGEGRPPIGRYQLEHADWLEMQNLLERQYGPEQAEAVVLDILLRIVPPQSLGLQPKVAWSDLANRPGAEPDTDTTPIEITPEVHEEDNMYRLQCPYAGVFRCTLTGLVLEGDGDVTYQTVPWDRKFLARKGCRPAGPLIKFTCLRGSFHRLHLPHCQIPSDCGRDFLSVAHVTEDRVDFLQPQKVTEKHVVISISGFSGFGLVRKNVSAEADGPINGMVLLFHQPSDDPELYASLYVLLLPRNVLIPQVTREWKRRSGADYIEALPDCELIPNQTYQLCGSPVQLIQPENAKFLNFEDYDNYTASFEVQLAVGVKKVELELKHSQTGPPWLPRWLFGSSQAAVWTRVIKLKAAPAADITEGNLEMTDVLLETLNSLSMKELETFKRHLSQRADPIPVSALEEADSMSAVDKMIQKYHSGGAKDVAVEILKKMHYNNLADKLQKK